MTSGDDRVCAELHWDPDIRTESFGDELRRQFCCEEEDSKDGHADIVVDLSEAEVGQEVVCVRITNIGSLDVCLYQLNSFSLLYRGHGNTY